MTKENEGKKSGKGVWMTLAGLAAGAAAVFFSKKENRDKAKEKLEESKKKAEEVKKKFEKAKKKVKKKAGQAAKKIEKKNNSKT